MKKTRLNFSKEETELILANESNHKELAKKINRPYSSVHNHYKIKTALNEIEKMRLESKDIHLFSIKNDQLTIREKLNLICD